MSHWYFDMTYSEQCFTEINISRKALIQKVWMYCRFLLESFQVIDETNTFTVARRATCSVSKTWLLELSKFRFYLLLLMFIILLVITTAQPWFPLYRSITLDFINGIHLHLSYKSFTPVYKSLLLFMNCTFHGMTIKYNILLLFFVAFHNSILLLIQYTIICN